MPRPLLLLLALSGLLAGGAARAAPPSVAVVYPDVREPYRGVFREIVRGMEEELGRPVIRYPLGDQQGSTDQLLARMKGDHVEVVITLGRAGYAAARSLSRELPVVIGAVLLPAGEDTQGLSGISMVPDPEILFSLLKELVPNARNVTVVYDPAQKAGEVARAQDAAEARGVTLRALPAGDLHLSAAAYRRALLDIKDGSAALWLPQNDAAMDEQALLPLVLRAAWDERFVVFSSNLDHVRRGALFSLYPDNFGMGRSLAAMAGRRAHDPPGRGAAIEPLRDVLAAVNLRTAEHLGLTFSGTTARRFGMTFPPRP